ncbi:hypothetical protein [Streptomyces luteogriseus]|uniref:hypothetical protein n=1 Tax=Streptomyces luteogriseus TaxID=68233 RepID=UPI00371EA067
MESEVIAALIGTPAVLVTAAAAWAAGRVQSRGAYHGPVDAIRRTAQREAYADLYRAARRFIDAYVTAEAALQSAPVGDHALVEEMRVALGVLDRAAEMVYLEGPEKLAEIAHDINHAAHMLGGTHMPAMSTGVLPLRLLHDDSAEARTQKKNRFADAVHKLLPAARTYLNGGPAR